MKSRASGPRALALRHPGVHDGRMLNEGTKAPDFELGDHFQRKISLSRYRNKQHVLLAFYPLDFTPT